MIKRLNIFKKKFINFKFFALFLLIFVVFLMFLSPKQFIDSISTGLSVWAISVVPSMFPFFVITRTLSSLNIVPYNCKLFKFLGTLFKVNSACIYIFIMSLISGYPVGAKLIQEYYLNGVINQKQATKLITFCSTSGPLFIIGTVGVMFLKSAQLGLILLISHILGATINGIVYRNNITKDTNINESKLYSKTASKNILLDIMNDSILSILVVGGYIALFFMLIDMLTFAKLLYPLQILLEFILKPFGLTSNAISCILNGLIEVTNGCKYLGILNIESIKKVAIASLLIGFGGFSIHMQSITFLISCKIKLKFYFLSKVTQALISCFISIILCLLFL